MRFSVLGPLEVALDEGPISLGGRKQRRLLAVLALYRDRFVARERLVESLWGQTPPPRVQQSLDAYVYRLRGLLGHDRIERQAAGYRLRLAPDEVDAERFEQLVSDAGAAMAEGKHRVVSAMLDEALGLWRGTAWQELADDTEAAAETRRLEELRLSAVEARFEARLALGDSAELVGELEQLHDEHPWRERTLESLMLALYRAGRQAEALETFQAARRRLVDELGLEPSPDLYALQQQILVHDPALGTRGARASPRRVARSRRILLPVAIAVAVVAAAVVAFGGGARGHFTPTGQRATGIVAVDAKSDVVTTAATLPDAPAAACTGAGSIWVADPSGGTVSRVDPRTAVAVDRISVGGDPTSIACGRGSIWAADADGATVVRIDPVTETMTQRLALGAGNLDALAFGKGGLWVANASAHELIELNPSTGRLMRTLPIAITPSALAFAAGLLWVTDYDGATVVAINPASGRPVGRVRVGTGPDAMAVAGGKLWVVNSLDATISVVDPRARRVSATVPVGGGPSAIAAGVGSVWVADQYAGQLSRISPARAAVVATVGLGGSPTALTTFGSHVWVGVQAGGGEHRGGTFVVASVRPFRSVDPAFFNGGEPPQFDGLAYDTLVSFDHTGGDEGLRLVPDLAAVLPMPTDDGRTYTFRLRPGIRYSNGDPVRASDFRAAIERLFRAGSPGTDFYLSIVGTKRCEALPRRCNLAHGIVTDDASGTIVFHLTAPDPEFLYQLTEQDYSAPVPPGTPGRDTGLHPFPGTGPYEITQADGKGVTFARNPYFREWSHAAQPEGDPDTIRWRYFPTVQMAVAAVQTGQAQWLNGEIPARSEARVALDSPAQLHTHPLFGVEFLPLNTRRAPFTSALARRALNYAINRNAIADMYGGSGFATPTCQPIAPGLPGYQRYCPYTVRPARSGAYTGPDITRARRLVARSGTRGEHVTVLGSFNEGYIPPQETAYVARVLRSLGYRTSVRLIGIQSDSQALERQFAMNTDGDWIADYPDPSSYIPPFLACHGDNNPGYFCDPALDREMRRAQSLELAAPRSADALWSRVDRTITDHAFWVPTVTPRQVDYVAKQVRDYQFNPVWAFLLDQSWVH